MVPSNITYGVKIPAKIFFTVKVPRSAVFLNIEENGNEGCLLFQGFEDDIYPTERQLALIELEVNLEVPKGYVKIGQVYLGPYDGVLYELIK